MTSPPPHDTSEDPAAQLNGLRVEIDRIDAAMHELLIERSAIIDRLIDIKQRQGGGSAFRPGREAEMMRRIAERHRGRLPLDTVESIWRVVISTFTFLQAGYAVHADMTSGDAAMRDSARFHFGFTVPLHSHFGTGAAIRAVAQAQNDLGLLPIGGHATRDVWWRDLIDPEAPKIIARLPFVERPDHPAGLPVFVIARPFAAAAARDIVIYAVTVGAWRDGLPHAVAELGGDIIGQAAEHGSVALMVAAPGHVPVAQIEAVLAQGGDPVRCAEIGSHAARFGMP